MSFTDEQKQLLKAPLSSANVKTRKQSGRTLSYLEGWVAIAEANRIFGHDGWTRETVYCKEISRQEVTIGKGGQYEKPGWKVGYEAKVKITAYGDAPHNNEIIREGTGHGSGSMSDLFDCIESAGKEAETDAMKRALMTFGNPFGLALYDKEQKNVVRDGGMSNEADQRMADSVNAYTEKAANTVAGLPRNEQEWKAWSVTFKKVIDGCKTSEQITASLKAADATLTACKKTSAKLHAHVLDYAQGRREILETPTQDTPNTGLGAG